MEIIATKEAYDALLADNTSVFVDFYADWCGPCKMVAPIVEKLAGLNPEVKFVKLNVDNTPEVAMMYGIQSIPTLLAFKNGELTGRIIGVRSEADLQALVNTAK